MRIADIVQDSIVDGVGLRLVVFTQGCMRNCPDCHNPKTHDPMGGREVSVDEIVGMMERNPLTDGLTLSGGEPFLQAEECALLASKTHELGLNVWCYSGYIYEELLEEAEKDDDYARLLGQIDVLVDGMFVNNQKTLNLKWRGSSNQRLIDVKKSQKAGKVVLIDS